MGLSGKIKASYLISLNMSINDYIHYDPYGSATCRIGITYPLIYSAQRLTCWLQKETLRTKVLRINISAIWAGFLHKGFLISEKNKIGIFPLKFLHKSVFLQENSPNWSILLKYLLYSTFINILFHGTQW